MTTEQAAKFLGISMNVSEVELKNRYKLLCKKWHPDLNHNNEEYATQMMQKINCAYNVMSNYVKHRQSQSTQNNFTHSNNQSKNQSNYTRYKQSTMAANYSYRIYEANGYIIREYVVNGSGIHNMYSKILNDFMKTEFDLLQTLMNSILR